MVCVQQLANAMDLDWALVQFLGWFQYLRWTACYRKGFSPGAWSLLADGLKSHNLPAEASARASLQKLWEATGAELLFAGRLTGQQAEDGRPRPDFSVHLRWQLPKPFPAVTFDDKPLLLHPSLQQSRHWKLQMHKQQGAAYMRRSARLAADSCLEGFSALCFFCWVVRSRSSGRYGFWRLVAHTVSLVRCQWVWLMPDRKRELTTDRWWDYILFSWLCQQELSKLKWFANILVNVVVCVSLF